MELLGLFFASQAWNVFVLSLLGFVAQLEGPPPDVDEHMKRLIRKAAYGPKDWCSVQDVTNLKVAFGFPGEFKDFATMGQAAMFRTLNFEDSREGGLHVRTRCDELQTAFRRTPHFVRSREWATWYERSHVVQMKELHSRLKANGIDRGNIEAALAKEAPRPWTVATCRQIRANFQKEVYNQVHRLQGYDPEERVRWQLRRFGQRDRRQAVRANKRLRHLAAAVPPRTWAAIHGAIWNRWATARRTKSHTSRCLFGCE